MARKQAHMLPSMKKKAIAESWAAVGCDTSMSSLAVCCIGYDAMLGKMATRWADVRWTVADDYISRLGAAARGHELILDCLRDIWVLDPAKTYIACEEPFPMGMAKKADSGWIKQQCEVSGAFIGSLARYGFANIHQINNQQWKKTLRQEGVTIRKMPEGKWDVKDWAISAYGIPDFPDLVSGKGGGKIPRPESGFGAKAKAVQPNDIYDAAAIMAWMADQVQSVILSPVTDER